MFKERCGFVKSFFQELRVCKWKGEALGTATHDWMLIRWNLLFIGWVPFVVGEETSLVLADGVP